MVSPSMTSTTVATGLDGIGVFVSVGSRTSIDSGVSVDAGGAVGIGGLVGVGGADTDPQADSSIVARKIEYGDCLKVNSLSDSLKNLVEHNNSPTSSEVGLVVSM